MNKLRKLLLLLITVVCLLAISAPAVAVPIDQLTPVYITQDGYTSGGETPVISADDFVVLLNSQHVNTPGTIYTLLEDITINASDLDYTYFTKTGSVENFLFYGSLEGNNHEIIVDTQDLAPGETARTLFAHIGSYYIHPRNMNDTYMDDQYMQNFTLRYTGDVGAASFAQGEIYNTHFENIDIIVEGDIVAEVNYPAFETYNGNNFPDTYKMACGFADAIRGHSTATGAADDITNYKIKNISVTAENIGNDITQPEVGYIVYGVYGFANLIGIGLDVSNLTLNYDNMHLRTNYAATNIGHPVCGVAEWIANRPVDYTSGGSGPLPIFDKIKVNVTGDMHAIFDEYAYLGTGYSGVYGISTDFMNLTNSTVSVGGDMISETLDNAKPAGTLTRDRNIVMGLGNIASSPYHASNPDAQFQNNTLEVGGSMIARGHGDAYIFIGVYNGVATNNYRSENNSFIIDGDITIERHGWALDNVTVSQSALYGIHYRLTESINDTLYVGGDVTITQDGANANSQAVFVAHNMGAATVTGGSATYDGNITVNSPTGTTVNYGFYYPNSSYPLLELSDNEFVVNGDIDVTSGAGLAYSIGFIYNYGLASNTTPRIIENNSAYIYGDTTITGATGVNFSGFAYVLGERAEISGNTAYYDGDIIATLTTGTLDTNNVTASGFASQIDGLAENNAVHITGDVTLDSTSSIFFNGFAHRLSAEGSLVTGSGAAIGNTVRIDGGVSLESDVAPVATGTHSVYGSGFASFIYGTAVENAVFIKDGITTNLTASGTRAEEAVGSFGLVAAADSVVNENTVIGRPGVPELYERFIFQVVPDAEIDDNFFTSALDGQRVSNHLTYNIVDEIFEPTEATAQEQLVVSDEEDFTTNPAYVLFNDVTAALSLDGVDQATSTLDVSGNLETAAYPAFLMLIHQQNSATATKDLPGIAYPYAANQIKGTVYRDDNNTGDTTSPWGGVTVNVLLSGTVVATDTTDAQGQYSIAMPLFSCLPMQMTVELVVPTNYTLGTAAANDFTTGTVIETFAYSSDYSYDGFIVGTAGAVTAITNNVPGNLYVFPGAEANYPPQTALDVTISNIGTDAVSGLQIDVTGDAHAFDVTALSTTSLAGASTVNGTDGGTATFAVTPIDGLADGTYNATITITGSNGATTTFDVRFVVGDAGGNGGGTTDDDYKVVYRSNGGKGGKTVSGFERNDKHTIISASSANVSYEGYTFVEWNTKADGTGTSYDPGDELTIKGDVTLYAIWEAAVPEDEYPALNMEDHFAYMQGYPDASFRPDGNITRAETAQMLYNLLLDTSHDNSVSFSDVGAGAWYYTAVMTMADKDIITGYPDGSFRPDAPISRAEFVAMLSRFSEISSGSMIFSDVPMTHWAYKEIVSATSKGWIGGYPDGTFRPAQSITRAEASKVTNALLQRFADQSYINDNPDLNRFNDIASSHWAYYDIMETTISHEYSKDDVDEETWLETL